MRRRLFVIGIAALLAASSATAKPTGADRKAAKRYVDAGHQAYHAGQYELAARAYEEAERLLPHPAMTFSIAQAYRLRYYQDRKPEHLRRALELYQRYLNEAPRGNRRNHATLHIEAIESILGAEPQPAVEKPAPAPPPTEIMVVSQTPGARARIDGSEWLDVPFARGVAPGQRNVEVQAPGFASARSEWLAVKGRLVVASVDLAPLPATLRVSAPPGARVRLDGQTLAGGEASLGAGLHVVTVTERGRRPAVRRLTLDRGERATLSVPELEPTPQRVAATWMLGGAGVLAVTGGVTTLLALSAEQRVRDYDAGIGSHAYDDGDLRDRNDALRARDRYRTASFILLGGAAAAGITGAALWWFDEPEPESTTGRLSPVVGPRTAGAAWRAAF